MSNESKQSSPKKGRPKKEIRREPPEWLKPILPQMEYGLWKYGWGVCVFYGDKLINFIKDSK